MLKNVHQCIWAYELTDVHLRYRRGKKKTTHTHTLVSAKLAVCSHCLFPHSFTFMLNPIPSPPENCKYKQRAAQTCHVTVPPTPHCQQKSWMRRAP